MGQALDEILEEWDWETGRPSGKPVSREDAHKNGIPHEGVHLWIARVHEGRRQLLFQKRSPFKSSYPDCLDITVGGHTLFGQTGSSVAREAYEEIGIDITENELTEIGIIRYEEPRETGPHREFQRVFLLLDNRPLSFYSFNDGEVTGICAVDMEDFTALLRKDHRFNANFFDGKNLTEKLLNRRDFHPELFSLNMRHYMKILIPSLNHLFETCPATGVNHEIRRKK